MSDIQDPQPSASDDEPSGPPELRAALKRMEAENAGLKDQLQELTDAARAQAFAQAGVPEDKWGAAFRQTYDGTVDVDAIKAKVEEWGVLSAVPEQPATPQAQAPAPSQEPDPSLQALGRIQEARGTESPSSSEANFLGEMQRMQDTGDFTLNDLESLLRQQGMLTEGS